MAHFRRHLNDLADTSLATSKSLEHERATQSSWTSHADNPYGRVSNSTNLPNAANPEIMHPSDSVLPHSSSPPFSVWRSDSVQHPRTIDSGRYQVQPAQSLTAPESQEASAFSSTSSPFQGLNRAMTQDISAFSSTATPSPSPMGGTIPRAFELPRILEIGGFLYQRTDLTVKEPATIVSEGHIGGPPLLHQHRSHPSHLTRGYPQDRMFPEIQLDQHATTTQTQSIGRELYQRKLSEKILGEAPMNIHADRGVLQGEPNQIQQFSDLQNTSETHSDMATSTRMHLTKTDLAGSNARKLERKSNILRTIKPRKKLRALDQEAFSEKPRSAPKHISTPAKTRRKSKMLLEIRAHNTSPERESVPDGEILDKLQNVPLTRSVRRDLLSFIRNEPRVPRKNLNLRKLMGAELGVKTRGEKPSFTDENHSLRRGLNQSRQVSKDEMDNWNVGDDDNECSSDDHETNDQSIRQSIENSGAIDQHKQKMGAELDWSIRDSMKSQSSFGKDVVIERPNSCSFKVENGLYVFSPTLAAFFDFGQLLKDIEAVAGHSVGFAKVVVPSDFPSETSAPSGSTSSGSTTMEANKISMSLNEDAAKASLRVYNMLVSNDLAFLEADEVLEKIRRGRRKAIKRQLIGPEIIARNDVWKESYAQKPYPEKKMIRHSEQIDGTKFSVSNELATNTLRTALGCKNPDIESLIGMSSTSRSTSAVTIQSSFRIATGPGPVYPLRASDHAAHLIHYHHSGASRIMTVTAPNDHGKVEKLVDIANQPPVYVPRSTLSSCGIDYTEVVQHQGEMVVIFPTAYHQAYTSGPSITEVIVYTSNDCKISQQEDLNHYCATRSPVNVDREDVN